MEVPQLLTIITILLGVLVATFVVLVWRIIKAIEMLRFVFLNANSIVSDFRGIKDAVKIGMLGTAISAIKKFTTRR